MGEINKMPEHCDGCRHKENELCDYHRTVHGEKRWRYAVKHDCRSKNRQINRCDAIFKKRAKIEEPEWFGPKDKPVRKMIFKELNAKYAAANTTNVDGLIMSDEMTIEEIADKTSLTYGQVRYRKKQLVLAGKYEYQLKGSFTPDMDQLLMDGADGITKAVEIYGITRQAARNRRYHLRTFRPAPPRIKTLRQLTEEEKLILNLNLKPADVAEKINMSSKWVSTKRQTLVRQGYTPIPKEARI